jgi:hypothetical protein
MSGAVGAQEKQEPNTGVLRFAQDDEIRIGEAELMLH